MLQPLQTWTVDLASRAILCCTAQMKLVTISQRHAGVHVLGPRTSRHRSLDSASGSVQRAQAQTKCLVSARSRARTRRGSIKAM